MTELNIFEPTPISMMPHHLFGSDRSPLFGTGTHWDWLQFHCSWSAVLTKKSLTCLYMWSKLALHMALNASAGPHVSPAAFPFLSFFTARRNSSQVMGSLSSHMVRCCGTCSRTVWSVEQWLLKTLWKWGPKTSTLFPLGSRIAMFVNCCGAPFCLS